jgi:2-oxoglutarate/2-oxoacid ferredoxin oxidoreductase subunit beta
MAQAIAHKGFSLVDCFSPCVTYNKVNTYSWFRERVYKLEDKGHDRTDFKAALDRSFEEPEKIPLGVFYQVTGRPTYEDLDGAIQKHGSAVKQKLGLNPEERKALWDGFK